MSLNIAINGFGRIGKLVLQAVRQRGLLGDKIKVIAIVDKIRDLGYLCYKINYDSIHNFPLPKVQRFDTKNNTIVVDKDIIKYVDASDNLSSLPWKELNVDCVVESTGVFTQTEQLREHLIAGARKVLVTAPYKDNDNDIQDKKTIIIGVNHHQYNFSLHNIISCASCTSNCIIPIISTLRNDDVVGIENGMVTSIHACTSSQNVLDGTSQKNWRDGRATGLNIIPTSTGFTKTISEIYPDMKGKISGMAFRVPISNVSVVDFTFISKKNTTIFEIDSLLKNTSETCLKGILGYNTEELVSSDFIGNNCSSIYDSTLTLQNNSHNPTNIFKIIAWYDNEWGYANRVVDMLELINNRIINKK